MNGIKTFKTFLALCTLFAYNGVFKFKTPKGIARKTLLTGAACRFAPTCTAVSAGNRFPSRGGKEIHLSNGALTKGRNSR